MPTKRLVVTVLTAALLATAAFAADSQPPAQPACPAHGNGFGGGPMGSLTPEQRMMHFVDVQKATSGMSDDQAHAWRRSEHDKVEAMTTDQRTKYAADLKTRWDALPAGQKADIQASFKEKHAKWDHHEGCK